MTQEEKAKTYDEAIKVIKDNLDALNEITETGANVVNIQSIRNCFYRAFPELKESEDEKMIGRIIKALQRYMPTDELLEEQEMVAWLEKQSNEPKKVSIWKHWKNGIGGGAEGEQIYLIKSGLTYSISSCLGFECDYIELSELDNLLHPSHSCQDITELGRCYIDGMNTANKVEPKFRDGQWIIWQDKCYKVTYNGCGYELIDQNGLNTSLEYGTVDENAHLWTIQDAKNGDVLVYKDEISLYKHDIKNCTKQETTFGGFVYHCCYDGKRFITNSLYSLTEQDKIDIHPATKEQRDTLFAKMREAGYEWDAEKKELKKIEHEIAESKDETIKKAIIDCIKGLKYYDSYYGVSPEEMLTWLERQGESDETINRTKFIQAVLKGTAINLVTWIDYKVAEGNMCLSNTECKDIIDALANCNWDKIYDYMKKKLEKQASKPKWTEEDVIRLDRICKTLWKNRKGDIDEKYQQEKDVDWLKSLKERMEE